MFLIYPNNSKKLNDPTSEHIPSIRLLWDTITSRNLNLTAANITLFISTPPSLLEPYIVYTPKTPFED